MAGLETAAAAVATTPVAGAPAMGSAGRERRSRTGRPLPLRPRGGFGGYLHDLRVERGVTIRQLAGAAGVHHTYISKLERGDRQAPEATVVEALAAALDATPSQLDQLRWRAGLGPQQGSAGSASGANSSGGIPAQGDPTLTLVAEALASASLPEAERARLRRAIAQTVTGQTATAAGSGLPNSAARPSEPAVPFGYPPPAPAYAPPAPAYAPPAPPIPAAPAAPPLAPAVPLDPRATLLAGLLSGWQTLDEAAAELRVTSVYLWELVQAGHLRAWALPGGAVGGAASAMGVRVRREDVLALLQPVIPGR